MFDYFRNYSSNMPITFALKIVQLLTKCLYGYCQFDDLDLRSRSQVRLKFDYVLTYVCPMCSCSFI